MKNWIELNKELKWMKKWIKLNKELNQTKNYIEWRMFILKDKENPNVLCELKKLSEMSLKQ